MNYWAVVFYTWILLSILWDDNLLHTFSFLHEKKKKGFIDTNWFGMRIGSAVLNGKRHHTFSTLLVIPLSDIDFISTFRFLGLFRQKLSEKREIENETKNVSILSG